MLDLAVLYKQLDEAIIAQRESLLAKSKTEPVDVIRYMSGVYHGLQTAKILIQNTIAKGGI